MNEQRLQAYYQLIQQLLSCPHGEEAAILQANRDLLDVGFLQMDCLFFKLINSLRII